MNDRPTALYDDLAIAPDPAFDVALRGQLEARMHDHRAPATPGVIDIEFDVAMPFSAHEPSRQAERGRSRRAVFAMAAAIVASVAVGVVVDELVVDDSTNPPALTVPSPTGTPTTIPIPTTTTTEPSFASDDIVAIKTLLWGTDYIPEFTPLPDWLPVTMDGAVAEQLPACQQFATTVFESESRPAVIESRIFQNDDGPFPYLMVQYVAVHPTVEQATAMLDGMQDPAFLNECVPAYSATLPPCSPSACHVEDWFPIYDADDIEPPAIVTGADDVWVRRYTGSPVTDGEGVVHDNPGDLVFAAVRVGRIVTTIDVVLIDHDGKRIATVGDFERIVQRLAERAAEAQAVS